MIFSYLLKLVLNFFFSKRYPVKHFNGVSMDPTLLADGVTPYSIAEIQQQQQDGTRVGAVQKSSSRSSLGAAGYKMMSSSQGSYNDQQGSGMASPGSPQDYNYGVYNNNPGASAYMGRSQQGMGQSQAYGEQYQDPSPVNMFFCF